MPELGKNSKRSRLKSPLPKLVKFFEKSRDKWKAKYKEMKYKAKLLSNQVRYLKDQNAKLKQRIKKLEKELSESGEKKIKKLIKKGSMAEKFDNVPKFHTYSSSHIFLFVQFVLFASISMRATSRILNLISSFLDLNIAAPSWYTGRLWLLRIGLYKLERPKQIADDWIWIIDHTIQLGKEKCLVILGIRQKHFPTAELYLKHEDVEPIALIPVEQSNGEVVFQQLEENIKKTGVPKQIVSDHGTDIKSGIASFSQKYNTIHTYDIKHKGAAILKRELKDEPAWQAFVKQSSNTGKKVQQTDLSVLAPPNQRSKARYMNVDKLIDWGHNALSYLDHEKSKAPKEFEKSTLYQKLGWIYGFRDNLKDWKILVEIIKTTNNYINFVGLFKNTHQDLEAELSGFAANEAFGHIPRELVLFVKEQEQNIADGDRLLGSSEIIESVIGKYKGLQRDQVKGGFTGMLLGLAASVSDFSMDTVQKAITFVSTKKVWQWIKDNVGKSIYSKRKEIHKIIKNMEQNQDDTKCPCQA